MQDEYIKWLEQGQETTLLIKNVDLYMFGKTMKYYRGMINIGSSMNDGAQILKGGQRLLGQRKKNYMICKFGLHGEFKRDG